MGTRHSGRKCAIQALFQGFSRPYDDSDFVGLFIDESEFDAKTKEWGKSLFEGAWAYKPSSDDLVSKYAIGWSLDRISGIDLSILRLAFYELNLGETPTSVVVNEAIELAKEFSSDESPKFINGILGKYVKECLQDS